MFEIYQKEVEYAGKQAKDKAERSGTFGEITLNNTAWALWDVSRTPEMTVEKVDKLIEDTKNQYGTSGCVAIGRLNGLKLARKILKRTQG